MGMRETKTISGQFVQGMVNVKCPFCEKPHKHQLSAEEKRIVEKAGSVTMNGREADCFLGQYFITLTRTS